MLQLVARGLSNPTIAEQLYVSEHTVHRHLANIFGKLGVSSRAAAVAHAARQESSVASTFPVARSGRFIDT